MGQDKSKNNSQTAKAALRQAKHFEALKSKTRTAEPAPLGDSDDDEEMLSSSEPLDRNKAYNPTTLKRAMGIGRRYYDGLMKAGLPHRKINGRFWFSGRLVIEFLEQPDNGEQTS